MKAQDALQCECCGRVNLHKDSEHCAGCGTAFGSMPVSPVPTSQPKTRLVPGGRRLELIQGGGGDASARSEDTAFNTLVGGWRPVTAPPSIDSGLVRATSPSRPIARPHRDPQLEQTVHVDARQVRATIAADAKETVIASARVVLGDGLSLSRASRRTRTANFDEASAEGPRAMPSLQHSLTSRGLRAGSRTATSRSQERPSLLDAMDDLDGRAADADKGGWTEVDAGPDGGWHEDSHDLDEVLAASGLGRRNVGWVIALLLIAAGGVTAALILT